MRVDSASADGPRFASADVAPIDCETTVRRLWDYLDEELDAARTAEVRRHLKACVACPPHFAFARSMLDALATSVPDGNTSPALRARILAAWRSASVTA